MPPESGVNEHEFMTWPATLLKRPATILGRLAVVLHVWVNAGYGSFRDELYYIVCGGIRPGAIWTRGR